MVWNPIEPGPRKGSWKREIRRGPGPRDASPYAADLAARDRIVASAFGTQMAFAGALGIVVVAAVVFYAQYSWALRWLSSVVLLGVVAIALARLVATRARDPRPLTPGGLVERRSAGELRSLAGTLDRASAGLKFSQLVFSVRMKDAFLEKVRVARGLSKEDIARVRGDPEALLRLIGDRDLVLFVLENERNDRRWPSLLAALPPRRHFAAESERLLSRMEAWR